MVRRRAFGLQIGLRAGGLLAMAGFFAAAARIVRPDQFADYVVALAIYSIAVVLSDFGVAQTAVVDLAKGDRDPDHVTGSMIRALLGTTVAASIAAGLIAVCISTGVGKALLLMGPSFLLNQAQIPFMVARQGRHEFTRVGMAEVGGRGLSLALLVGMSLSSSNLGLGWVVLASTVGVAFQLVVVFGPLPGSVLSGGAGLAMVRRSLSLGLTNAAAYLHVRIDQILLAVLSTATVVASYAVAYRVVDAALGLVSAVSVLGLPLLAGADPIERSAIARNLHSLLLALASVGAAATFLLAEPLARVLGGAEYSGAGALLRALSPTIWIAVVNLLGALVLVAQRRTRVLIVVGVATVILNLALNLVLIPIWGGEGAAMATGTSEAMGAVIVGVVAARALPGVYHVARLLACGAVTAVGTVGAWFSWEAGLAPVAALLVAAMIALLVGLTGERSAANDLLARLRSRRADDALPLDLDEPGVRDLA